MNENIYTMPLVPLRGIIVFPEMILHFDVSRPKSIEAVENALQHNKLVFLCYQNDYLTENPDITDLAEVGTICEVRQILRLPDGVVRILVEGKQRAKLMSLADTGAYVRAEVRRLDDEIDDDDTYTQLLMRKIQHLIEEYLDVYDRVSPEAITALMSIEDPGEMTDIVISNLPVKPTLKQSVLNSNNVHDRMEKLITILSDEIDLLDIEKNVMEQVQQNLDENQRDYVLREKLKVIRDELGEDDDPSVDISKYKSQMSRMRLSDDVREKLNDELDKMSKMMPHSQEYALIQTYVETVLSLPWDKSSEEKLDISAAKIRMEKDHYGLDKVKERILEYIAVRKLTGKTSGNILCLAGPPGTGKTSIVSSMAKAVGRKYIRLSLGGVHNEAEIRGHRKTYIGAMPGRIIDAMKRAGVNNPVILLDEIDKMTTDISGDPSSAMLEVLDPEQNKEFRDNYIELPFDLSNVMFIASANNLANVPRPLLDRMDVIEVSGYTENEKLIIAKKYLVSKQRKKNGVTGKNLTFSTAGLKEIIDGYTRESGVRNLEREIAKICRKTAVHVVEDPEYKAVINKGSVSDFLGKRKFNESASEKMDSVGIAMGLAWTEVGGETLPIEVNVMEGSGKLELTGNLGDVMKESAKAAYSYIRANAYKFGISPDFYKTRDIHIHIPEGAVPKDGPSAGITMTTAMVSALSEVPVRHDVAMTGEVTLRGNVLPIGGLKEKTLAALRVGSKRVIIPFENKADYEELPDIVKDNMEFKFAKNMDEVLKLAMAKPLRPVLPMSGKIDKGIMNIDGVGDLTGQRDIPKI